MKKYIPYILIILAALFVGCNTPKHANKRVSKTYGKHPVAFLNFCSQIAPPIVETKDSIVYSEGKTIYKNDTITIDCDSVVKYVSDTKVRVITKTIYKRDTIYKYREKTIVDKAGLLACNKSLDRQKEETIKHKSWRQIYFWIALVGWVIILLILIWNIWLKKWFAGFNLLSRIS